MSNYKAPNGLFIEQNDIDYLTKNNEGMTEVQAVDILSKEDKYTKEVDPKVIQAQEQAKKQDWLRKQQSLQSSPTEAFNRKIGSSVAKGKDRAQRINAATANGTQYAAIVDGETKSTSAGQANEVAPNGKPYEENDIRYLMNNGYSREDAITLLSRHGKYAKKALENPIQAQKQNQEQHARALENRTRAEAQAAVQTSSSMNGDKMDVLISEQKQTNQLLGAILKAITANGKDADKETSPPKPESTPQPTQRHNPYAVAFGAKSILDDMARTRSGDRGYMSQIGNNPYGIIGNLDRFSAQV